MFGGHEDMVSTRLTFANGCVAHVTASRISQKPKRRMRIWAPEGYAGADFVTKRLTLVEPSPDLRRQGLALGKLDPSLRSVLKEEVFGRFLKVAELDCNRGDQLTNELRDFVRCVRTGTRPRVSGEDGRAAIALADRVMDSLREHPWDGRADGPKGPAGLPMPRGSIVFPPEDQKAA